MRFFSQEFAAGLLLLTFIGCGGPDPYAAGREFAAEQIKEVQLGTNGRLHWAPIDLLEAAATDPRFCENVRELTLSGDFSQYSNVALGSFVRLESVTLVDTTDTDSFLTELPPSLKTLVLDRTDLTCGTGASQRLNDRDAVESWFTTIANFGELESMFMNPWNRRLTSIAADALSRSTSLKELDIEWADEHDVAALQKALPNCKVKLVTEH